MPDPALRVVAAALAATFAWAALAKLGRWTRWRAALSGYELPGAVRALAAPVVPVVEGGVAALLVTGFTRAGAALSVALLASFSGALLYARERRGDRLPCGCFGGATERDYRVMLLRNALLGLASAVLLLTSHDVSVARGWSAPSGGDLVPGALVAIGIGLVGWTLWRVGSSLTNKGQR